MLNIGKILTFVSKKHQKWSKSHEFLMFFNKYALNFSNKKYFSPPPPYKLPWTLTTPAPEVQKWLETEAIMFYARQWNVPYCRLI